VIVSGHIATGTVAPLDAVQYNTDIFQSTDSTLNDVQKILADFRVWRRGTKQLRKSYSDTNIEEGKRRKLG
jgi:hypothetical protein